MRPLTTLLAILALTGALFGCRATSTSSAEITPPSNWPIPGLTLPAGSQAEFSPGPVAEFVSKLPRRRRLGETRPQRPMPGQWNAFFSFEGEPSQVFEHVDRILVSKQYRLDPQEIELGNPNEARIHNYVSPDKVYSVSLRYWKVSDTPGAKPYHLLIRDVKTPPAP